MDKPLELIKQLPEQALKRVQTLWARWTGTQETHHETVYWSIKDMLVSAAALAASKASFTRGDCLEAGDPRCIDREQASASLRAAIAEWRAGRSSMVVVHGPQGCGVSSLLAQLPALLEPDDLLVRERMCARLQTSADAVALAARIFNLDKLPASLDELIATLQQIPPRVITLDDAHLLAFRVMGTRAAVRSFGSIMVASQPRHLWIMGIRRQAWRRLVYMYQADRYFTHNIELDYLSADELKTAVTQHFAAAQIELDWASQTWSRLQQYSRGKPDLALLYSQLLQAQPATDEDKDEQPEILRPIDVSALKSLSMDELFSLAELAVHGNLSAEEHQHIFRESYDGSLMRLEQLCNQNLVERFAPDPDCGGHTPRYRIIRLLSGLIADHLYKSNYLY